MAKQCWDNRHRKWAENKKLKNVKASTNLKRKFLFESWLTESKINNLLSLHGKKINGPSYDFGYRVFRYKRSQLASFYLWVDLWHLRVCGYAGMHWRVCGYLVYLVHLVPSAHECPYPAMHSPRSSLGKVTVSPPMSGSRHWCLAVRFLLKPQAKEDNPHTKQAHR